MKMSLAELGILPRLVTRDQAASYCGLSPQGFSEWIRAGRLPCPIEGTSRWDLKAIDAALDAASGLAKFDAASALDTWRANRALRSQGNPQGQ
jgi:predicted DNA-binding transcriptional regulator AlpA